MTLQRDGIGQFATTLHSEPELSLSPDIEGLRATLVDFLDGSLSGFRFQVGDVEPYVDQLVGSLLVAHTS